MSSSKTIVIADDDKFHLEKITKTVQAAGFRVLPAAGGKEAQAIATSEKVDLIVADYLMPDQSGLGLTFELRRGGLKTPVLIMSEASFLSAESVTQSGANGFLKKPFSDTELMNSIKKALPA